MSQLARRPSPANNPFCFRQELAARYVTDEEDCPDENAAPAEPNRQAYAANGLWCEL